MNKTLWKKVHDASKKHKEWSMILTDYLSRPVTWSIIKFTKFTPNQISIFSFLLGIVAAYFLSLGGYRNLVIGASLAMGYNVLDMCDGMVARIRNQRSILGHWTDGVFGFILFPIIIVGLSLGIKSSYALLVGLLAIVSYPLQYNLIYFYKLEVMKTKEKIDVPSKWESLRYMYGSSFFYIFLLVAALLNQPWAVLIFWATLGNLYWIALLVMQYRAIRQDENHAAHEGENQNKREYA